MLLCQPLIRDVQCSSDDRWLLLLQVPPQAPPKKPNLSDSAKVALQQVKGKNVGGKGGV